MIVREPSQNSRVESGCQMNDQTEGASKPRVTPKAVGHLLPGGVADGLTLG